MSDQNIVQQTLQYPIQAIVPFGKSGDGFNMFRAPSQWVYHAAVVVPAANTAVIAAVPNRSIRLYKYHLMMIVPSGAATGYLLSRFGGSSIMLHIAPLPYAAAQAMGYFVCDFGPVGLASASGTNLNFLNAFGAANIEVYVNVQYSTEAWGALNTDGSDIG